MNSNILVKTVLFLGLFLQNAFAFAIDYNITAPGTLETTENGGTAEFQVGLSSYPASPDENVTIHCHTSNPAEAVCSGTTSWTFLAITGNYQKTFSVTGVSDNILDGNTSYEVIFSTQSIGNDYDENFIFDATKSQTFTLTNIDNELVATIGPKVIISQTGGHRTYENGDVAAFTVKLAQAPTSDVRIDLNSSDTTEGTINKSSLTFTPSNWDITQVVLISGVDDSEKDGNKLYSIILDPALSADSYYNAYDSNDVTLSNIDNDFFEILIRPLGTSQTWESNTSTTQYAFSLLSQPLANVTVMQTIATDTTEFIFSTSNFLFTPSNWNVEQILTVTGVDDNDYDGNISQTISYAWVGTSNTGILNIMNIDNEGPPNTFTLSGNTSEDGGTASLSVVLNTAPTSNVVYLFESSDTTEGDLNISTIVFTPSDWNTTKTVFIEGVDDAIFDLEQRYKIKVSVVTNDPNFQIPISPITSEPMFYYFDLINEDNERLPSLVVINSNTSEYGDTGSFSIALDSQPERFAKFTFQSNNTAEGIVIRPSSKYVVFNSTNWNIPQVITIKGVDDNILDNLQEYQITTLVSSNIDASRFLSHVRMFNLSKTIPTPEPITEQLLDSPADELETDLILDRNDENTSTITLTFTSKTDGTQSKIEIPKIVGKTINTIYSAEAIEFTMDDAIASYNNNGTTEHSISVDNKSTIAISFIPEAIVEFTNDGGVQTSLQFSGTDILIVATPNGESFNSVTNTNGIQTKADSTIVGTKTIIQEDGKLVVDTPEVLSDLGNKITTTSTLDPDGNILVSAVKVLPDGTLESIPLGNYGEGSEVIVKHIDGAVVVEVITSVGTQSFTIRSGRR